MVAAKGRPDLVTRLELDNGESKFDMPVLDELGPGSEEPSPAFSLGFSFPFFRLAVSSFSFVFLRSGHGSPGCSLSHSSSFRLW